MVLVSAISAPAQVLQLQGGSSSLLGANGGSLELHTGSSTGRFDVGTLDRPEIGFSYTRSFHGWDVTAGDQGIPFVLPTDLFNRSYYFLGRGLRLQNAPNSPNRMLVYAGTTSQGFKTPFLNVARSERGVGLIFYRRQLSPTKRFYSYNIFSSRQTSLQGLEWTPHEGLKLATTAGIGDNQRYWAGSLDYKRDWIWLQTSYTRTGDSFRRVEVQAPLVAETTGPNLRVQLLPRQWLTLALSHQNYLSPIPDSPAGDTASVDTLGTSITAAGLRLSGSFFHSRTNTNNLNAFTVGAQRNLWGRVEAGASYFQSHAAHSDWHSLSSHLREKFFRHFSFSQLITKSNGSTTVGLGGTFSSNLFSISLEHQTLFFPFSKRTQSPFRQALVISVQLQLPHNIRLHGATNVDAFGHLRYTSYADSYFYPHGSGQDNGGRYRSLPGYVVRGIVVDEQTHPIRGAALEIDGQTVFTDSQGLFQVRMKKRKACSVQILADQFMFPGHYEVVSAPSSIESATEERAIPYEIVLRRVSPHPPVLTAGPGSPKQVSH